MATIAMLLLPKQSQRGNGCHVVLVWARALQPKAYSLQAKTTSLKRKAYSLKA